MEYPRENFIMDRYIFLLNDHYFTLVFLHWKRAAAMMRKVFLVTIA